MTPTISPSGCFVRLGDANAGSRIPCDAGLSKAANVQSCSGDAEAMPASGPSPRYAPEAPLVGPQDMVVNAGDSVTATVTSLGGHRFKLTLVDNTQGESFSTVKTSRAAKCDSAEIIVESHLAHDMGLADFDPVQFTNCAVDGRPITSFQLEPSDITAIGNLVETSTSAPGAGGSSFTVTRR